YSPWRTDSQIQDLVFYVLFGIDFYNFFFVNFAGHMMKLYFMGNLRLNLLDVIFMIF
ncbi:unnamed protein product, partial [Brassica oleracea var. botrytis]